MIKRKLIIYGDFKYINLHKCVSNIKTSLCPVLRNSVLQNIINIHAPTKITLIMTFFSLVLLRTLHIQEECSQFKKKFKKNPSTETKLVLSIARKITNLIYLVQNPSIIIKV